MPVGVHCTMRKYSRINWGYYLWNADLVVLVTVDRAEPVCVHLTQRQVTDPTPVTQVGTRTMFLYFCCPAQWISSVFPLTTDVSAPIRSSRFITYLLASSLPLASLPSPSSPPWSSEPGSAAFYALRRQTDSYTTTTVIYKHNLKAIFNYVTC